MRTRIVTLFAVALFCLTGIAGAQEKIDPAFERIEPFLKENTFLVTHVDLKNLDLDALGKKVVEKVNKVIDTMEASQKTEEDGSKKDDSQNPPQPGNESAMAFGDPKAMVGMMVEMTLAPMKQVRQGMLDAGVEEFFTFSMVETMKSFSEIMAIPGEPNFDDQTAEALRMAGYMKAGFGDDMTFYVKPVGAAPMGGVMSGMAPGMASEAVPTNAPKVSPESFMNALRRAKTKYRPEINDALYLQRKSPIRVVFAPSKMMKDSFRVIQAMLPVPPEMIGVDSEKLAQLVREMETLSVGLDLAALRLNAAIQFSDAEKAEETEKIFSEFGATVEDEMARVLVHEFLPKANKKRLILVVKEEQIDKLIDAAPQIAAMMPTTGPMGGMTVEVEETEAASTDSME